MTRARTTQPVVPRTRRGRAATDYLYWTNDATVLLRYADAQLKGALVAAPDEESREEIREISANCGLLLRQLKQARNATLARYTPSGEPKSKPPSPTKGR